MKRKLTLLALICMSVFLMGARAQYFPDIILKGGIWTDSRAYDTLLDAISTIGSTNATIYVNRNETIDSTNNATQIGSNITLKFFRDGCLTITDAWVDVYGTIDADQGVQILFGNGTVNGTPGNAFVDPDWYSGSSLTMSWDVDTVGTFGGLNPVYVTENYNASSNDLVWANTSSGNFTIYLPTSPRDGDVVGVIDASANFASTPVQLSGNGNTINSNTLWDLDVENLYTEVTYDSNVGEWLFKHQPYGGVIVGFGTQSEVLTTNSTGDGYSWNSTDEILESVYGRGSAGQKLSSNGDGTYSWQNFNATYQVVEVATTYNCSSTWQKIHASTSAGNYTIYLPDSANVGDRVAFLDVDGVWNQTGKNLAVYSMNASNPMKLRGAEGVTFYYDLDIADLYAEIEYVNGTHWQWIVTPEP